MNFHELDNFNLADAVKFHRRLNPALWGTDEHLLPQVREKLLAVADDFREFLGVDDLKLVDITLSGSNAAYSYTANSDIDLHLVVDMPDDAVYQELFDAKKYQYNDTHNIRIGGADVELYVQPSDQAHHSQGIYSVKNSDWLQVPQRRRARIDDRCVQSKTADLDARIHAAIKTKNLKVIDSLWHKIKTMRQTGLEKNGEFGCENIAFKLLRNKGCIADLIAAKTAARDQQLSLNTRPRERKTVNYGMRDYWYAGTAYAGQDHAAGTESEQLDENTDSDQLKKILNRFYSSCVSKLQLQNPPHLRLETTSDWSKENGSFGQYDSDSNTLILATAGRHVLDILRTMAHEMTHRQQDEREPLPIDAGATGSPYEDQANAMAGRIMRDWADQQPEMFDGVPLEEASGYIPTRKQARDPRFVMALTRDVQPGAVGREANKLGLATNAQGRPALLMKSANTLAESLALELAVFEEQDLFEINMSSGNLRREAAGTGALAGMEFEMIVPNVEGGGDNEDLEPDYDYDQSCRSIQDAYDFFYDGDFNSRRDVDRMRESMREDYIEWLDEKIVRDWRLGGEEYMGEWVLNNVDESVWNPDDLEGNARNEALEEYAVNVHADSASRDYESALEEFREENQESYDESDWLDDTDLDRMQYVENTYGMTWPHWSSPGRGEASIEDVAQGFENAIDRDTRASDNYHSGRVARPSPTQQHYVVEPDGSLDADDSNARGLEFVSPPLPLDEILSDLNKVRTWAREYGCYTNDSTGLHINISVPNYTRENLDFVKLALLMGDQYVLDAFGRTGNTYAKSAMGIIKDAVRNKPEDAAQLLDKMKGGLDQLATRAIHSGVTAKYTSINTKDGHIEFRSPGGDWLGDNFDQIENTLLRFTVAMSAALNPDTYRQEYQKKLYKLLTQDQKDSDTIRYFSDYVAGKIPRAALRSFVRQAQLQRSQKKNPAAAPAGDLQYYNVRDNSGYTAMFQARNPNAAMQAAREQMPGNFPNIVDVVINDQATAAQAYAPVPGSTLDLQRQPQAAAAPRPIPGVQDIDIDIPVAAPRTTFTGNWLVQDQAGNTVHRFGGIGNSQADANRVAAQWLAQNGYDAGMQVSVSPELAESLTADDQPAVMEVKINNASGIAAVPNNQQIAYLGLQVVMQPSMYLELAAPLDAKSADERETIEYIKKNLDQAGVAAPWLTVVIPEAWESGDFSQMAHVRDHDGRHRMHSILEQEGNDPVEVHIVVPHMRRRHITDAMVDQLRSGMLNQQGQYVSGPIFGAAR